MGCMASKSIASRMKGARKEHGPSLGQGGAIYIFLQHFKLLYSVQREIFHSVPFSMIFSLFVLQGVSKVQV